MPRSYVTLAEHPAPMSGSPCPDAPAVILAGALGYLTLRRG
jgi:hypothetical protein